jgi:hypothetical protein
MDGLGVCFGAGSDYPLLLLFNDEECGCHYGNDNDDNDLSLNDRLFI